jgi:transposase InsO family protein
MATPEQIATWRYEQIAPLLDPNASEAERIAHVAALARTPVEWPLAERDQRAGRDPRTKPISRATAYRWCTLYNQHGLDGLRPEARPKRPSQDIERATICDHAIALLYERPGRSLTQLLAFLRASFPDTKIARATLHRDLVAHPAYAGILARRRGGGRRRRRDLYETRRFHQIWQIDAKGPFAVDIAGRRTPVRVISVIEAKSRTILAATISAEEDLVGVVRVLRRALAKYGLPERVQMDRHATYDAWALREGLALLGVRRRWIKPRNPSAQGLVEAYHKSLGRWFIDELPHQEVRSLAHLELLLGASIDQIYNAHHHRTLKSSPAAALGARLSNRMVGEKELARAFWVEKRCKSHAKTGLVQLPGGVAVQVASRYLGKPVTIRYAPDDPAHAELVDGDRRYPLEPYQKKDPCATSATSEERGTGELQKLVDVWRGEPRPNAQPGFGLPEVFAALVPVLGHRVPADLHEAETIQRFYQTHGPFPAEPFRRALAELQSALGPGRPLAAYLDHLARLIRRAAPPSPPSPETPR